MRTRIQKISKYRPSIFQGRFDFSLASRSYRGRGLSLTIEHPGERYALKFFAATLTVLTCAYVYFVGASILNVIARKDAQVQIASLASAVSDLERDYFSSSQELGPEDGERLGLSPVSNTVYVHRPGNAAAAALPSNEI